MKILAFTGMPASGKTVAVQIARDRELPIIRMGEAVWDETTKRGLELNDHNVGSVANKMRDKYGKDIWAKRTLEKIKSIKNTECIIIDGIRNVEEIEAFKKELGNDFTIIAVEASNETRKKRVLSRGRKDDSKDIKDIEERDKRELGWGLGTVIASADLVITNEGNIEDFQKAVEKTLNEFLKR